MNSSQLASTWASEFGLALTPMFGSIDADTQGDHYVLLDGGFGSFALSITSEEIWTHNKPVDWSWSSDLSHHVTISENKVAVVRWDKPTAEVFSRQSVEEKRNEFYRFLTTDRVRSNRRVVPHIVETYRKMRSLIADARLPDDRSTDAFLGLLYAAIERSPSISGIATELLDERSHLQRSVLMELPETSRDSLVSFLLDTDDFDRDLTLIPTLAIRHAGSEIFQEAHYELLRAPSPDLFGHVEAAEAGSFSRGGAHFTPPALARSLTEQVLREMSDIEHRAEITLMDPACGSGAFLHEALRTLERIGYQGKINLVGRDVSASAISMASFVLHLAEADWSPAGGLVLDLQTADSLTEPLPKSDIILMNPPFIAWSTMNSLQRDQMLQTLGADHNGRGDLSMAFISTALSALRPGGVVGSLMPNSLLSLQSAKKWRDSLIDQSDIRFLSSLGEYGLFSYATVQVAAMVLKKQIAEVDNQHRTLVLTASNSAEATSRALRQLRRTAVEHSPTLNSDFRLFQVDQSAFIDKPTWRLLSPETDSKLFRIRTQIGMTTLENVFRVHQGIQTGMNPAFLLSTVEFSKLPKREKMWFRPAIMNEAISGGSITPSRFLFYPYDNEGLAIKTEADLMQKVPQYAAAFLIPEKERLSGRAAIVRSGRNDWWALMEPRLTWALKGKPRILSKRFGSPGGFALDLEGRVAVVQAFAWLYQASYHDPNDDMTEGLPLSVLLQAYTALLNSNAFLHLLSLFSPQVAGGQFDLSARFVNQVPFPELNKISQFGRMGKIVQELAELGSKPSANSSSWLAKADQLTNQIYNTDLLDLI